MVNILEYSSRHAKNKTSLDKKVSKGKEKKDRMHFIKDSNRPKPDKLESFLFLDDEIGNDETATDETVADEIEIGTL